MAGTPQWKVFDAHGTYQASCKEVEAAACLLTFYGDGSSIRFGHAKGGTVFTQGADGDAGDSYDAVVDIVTSRRVENHRAGLIKTYGPVRAAEVIAELDRVS